MSTPYSASVTSTAPAAAFFARWADMATWPQWNTDTEWVRLDGPFEQGATGTLKPKGGPKVGFVVERLNDSEFVDVSRLLGARLTFAHVVTTPSPGLTEVRVSASFSGPLAAIWRRLIGKGIAATLGDDLRRLAATAEADVAAETSA